MTDVRSRRLKPLNTLVRQEDLALFEQIRRHARDLAPVVRVWHRVVPAPLAHHVQPVLIQKGTLTVWTDSPAWAHTLRHSQPSIIARLHELGLRGIDRIESRPCPVDLPHRPRLDAAPDRDSPASPPRLGMTSDPATNLAKLRRLLEQL